MYSFQAGTAGRKRDKRTIRLLLVLIFILIVALAALAYTYVQQRTSASAVADSLSARATSEAGSAQSAVYRLTQSSGTNTAALLADIRSHIYAMQCLNQLASNIYGASVSITDPAKLDACLSTLDACQVRLQAGGVLTTQFTQLKDEVDAVAALFGL